MPDFSFEDGYDGPVCGLDEVGRGPLAGPVVAACVIIDRARIPAEITEQINDSKKLTEKKRTFLFNKIYEFSYVSIAQSSVEDIDRINILQASLRAMEKSFRALCKEQNLQPVAALVDGNQPPKLKIPVKTIIQGDSLSVSIAAASIVAKHYRDGLMKKLARKHPEYGWENNAGYGTREHLEALEKYGVTPFHRRSFAPVSKQLVKENSANY